MCAVYSVGLSSSLACGYLVVQHYLFKRFFSHWNVLRPLLKVNSLLNIVFVCDSHSILLVYVYSYNSTTHFGSCRSMLSFEKGKCVSSISFFFFFFKIVLAILAIFCNCGSAGKESACNVGDLGSIPGFGRSPEEGKGYPLQHSGLENSMGYTVHGVAKSQTRLSNFHF